MAPPVGVPGGPELLLAGVFFPIVPFVMAYLVSNDAEKRGAEHTAGLSPSAVRRSSRSSVDFWRRRCNGQRD